MFRNKLISRRGVPAPGPAGVGAVPRGTGSHFARLGVSGEAEVQPHARGSRLYVHTELFVYVGASRHSCQFFISVGAPLGPDLGGGPEPTLCIVVPPKMVAETSVALTKMRYSREPLGRQGWGPSPGALTALAWGSRVKPKHGRSGSGPEPPLPILLLLWFDCDSYLWSAPSLMMLYISMKLMKIP